MNRWRTPDWLEYEVKYRDVHCVYCGIGLVHAASDKRCRPSWEHIVNDATIVTRENIALCCTSCNASKGAKDLVDWLESQYCKRRGITADSVAPVIQDALRRQ